jgi:P-type Cu2+ transporter
MNENNHSHSGHDDHHGHSVEMFRVRFWICLVLTIPALVWEPMLQDWFVHRAASSRIRLDPGIFWNPGLLWRPGLSCGARPGAGRPSAGHDDPDRPGDQRCLSLQRSGDAGVSRPCLWWELATLVTIMLLGHWIEMRSVTQAQGALKELAKLLPDTAERSRTEIRTEEVPVDNVAGGRPDPDPSRGAHPATGSWRAGKRAGRGHGHRRVKTGPKIIRGQSGRRYGQW